MEPIKITCYKASNKSLFLLTFNRYCVIIYIVKSNRIKLSKGAIMFTKEMFIANQTVTSETQTVYQLLVSDAEYNIRNKYAGMLQTVKSECAILKRSGYLRKDYVFVIQFNLMILLKQYMIQFDVLTNQTLHNEFDVSEIMDLRNADYMQISISLYRQFALYQIRSDAQKVNEIRANFYEDKSF